MMKRFQQPLLTCSLFFTLWLLDSSSIETAFAAIEPVGRVVNLSGQVLTDRPIKAQRGLALHANDPLFEGDLIKTGVSSRVDLLIHDSLISLSEQSEFSITSASVPRKPIFELIRGKIRSMICKVFGSKEIVVVTPNAVIGMRGTMVDIAVAKDLTWICPLSDGDPSIVHFSKTALEVQRKCEALEEMRKVAAETRGKTEREEELSIQASRCWEKFDKLTQMGNRLLSNIDVEQKELNREETKLEIAKRADAEKGLQIDIPDAHQMASWRSDLTQKENEEKKREKELADLRERKKSLNIEVNNQLAPLWERYNSAMISFKKRIAALRRQSESPYLPDRNAVTAREKIWGEAKEVLSPLDQEIDHIQESYWAEQDQIDAQESFAVARMGELSSEQQILLNKVATVDAVNAFLHVPPQQTKAQPVSKFARYLIQGTGTETSMIAIGPQDRALAAVREPALAQAVVACEETMKKLQDLKNALECMAVYRAKQSLRSPASKNATDWEKKCDSQEYTEHPERRPAECRYLEAARECSSVESFQAVAEGTSGPGSSGLFPSSSSATVSDTAINDPGSALAEATAEISAYLSPNTNVALASLTVESPYIEGESEQSAAMQDPGIITPFGEDYLESFVPTPICF